ncbi:MAG: DUF1080 domain-containing protein [Sedimentisphaerales bacterium]|nr:DUF1080 domain-containing protein [Sedimentisphaerales bacterium]
MKSIVSLEARQSLIPVVLLALTVSLFSVAGAAPADPLMGDWQGRWELVDAYESGSLAAEVIALGEGRYRARLLEGFAMTVRPFAVLEGRLQDGEVEFAGPIDPDTTDLYGKMEATLVNGKFAGRFEGETSGGERVKGEFSLEKTVRRSPTLGAKPPAGAIVLFDGTNFDEWASLGGRKGLINIAEVLGSTENAVAYLRAKIWSPRERSATLQLGTDDGVKVWLNGAIVHANNALRGVTPGQDKVDVTLKQGSNELMLKVTNGGGDWGAIVRVVDRNNKPLRNLREVSPQFPSNTGSDEYLRKNNGVLTQWQVAGPYQQGGKGPEALFDVAFAPEKSSGGELGWKWFNANDPDDKRVKWRIVDGAMEAKAGTGSIVTKRKFKDFKLHIEFRTPFMPEARGQARGNSGVYLQGRYEVQVLDSYGLESKDNECGGIYKVGAPLVNMCLPPGQWQTYDMTFRAPRFNAGGDKTGNAVVTVMHNGVAIHDERPIPGPTGGALDNNAAEPGGIYLQDHGNPVQFRNIWIVELN